MGYRQYTECACVYTEVYLTFAKLRSICVYFVKLEKIVIWSSRRPRECLFRKYIYRATCDARPGHTWNIHNAFTRLPTVSL